MFSQRQLRCNPVLIFQGPGKSQIPFSPASHPEQRCISSCTFDRLFDVERMPAYLIGCGAVAYRVILWTPWALAGSRSVTKNQTVNFQTIDSLSRARRKHDVTIGEYDRQSRAIKDILSAEKFSGRNARRVLFRNVNGFADRTPFRIRDKDLRATDCGQLHCQRNALA
jgi:hypothetical protein